MSDSKKRDYDHEMLVLVSKIETSAFQFLLSQIDSEPNLSLSNVSDLKEPEDARKKIRINDEYCQLVPLPLNLNLQFCHF